MSSALGSKPQLYLIVSPQRQAKYNKYTLEERVKMGGYGRENGPAKFARHFQIASHFLVEGRIAKFKI